MCVCVCLKKHDFFFFLFLLDRKLELLKINRKRIHRLRERVLENKSSL